MEQMCLPSVMQTTSWRTASVCICWLQKFYQWAFPPANFSGGAPVNGQVTEIRTLVFGLLACLGLGLLCFGGKPAAANPVAFGINLPWVNYGADFGADPKYPGYGPKYNGAQMQGYLDDMKSKNMNIVRVWLFEDTSGLSFSGNYCTGVSQTALNNIKDFVNRANRDGIEVYCMLFNNDIPAGYITNDNGDSLVNNVIIPLAHALNGKWVQYDLMNECDYASSTVGFPKLRNFFYNANAAIHNVTPNDWVTASDDHSSDFNSNFYSTVGGLGFNFYDYHQYSDAGTPLRVTPAAVHNAPLYLGEYGPTKGWDHNSDTVNQHLIDDFALQVVSKGYTGMLAWSYTGDSNYQLQNNNALWVLNYYGNLWVKSRQLSRARRHRI